MDMWILILWVCLNCSKLKQVLLIMTCLRKLPISFAQNSLLLVLVLILEILTILGWGRLVFTGHACLNNLCYLQNIEISLICINLGWVFFLEQVTDHICFLLEDCRCSWCFSADGYGSYKWTCCCICCCRSFWILWYCDYYYSQGMIHYFFYFLIFCYSWCNFLLLQHKLCSS